MRKGGENGEELGQQRGRTGFLMASEDMWRSAKSRGGGVCSRRVK